MELYADTIIDLEGNVVSGADILVLNEDKTIADIFDASGNPIMALSTGGRGEFAFSAANGKYFVQVSVKGNVKALIGPVTLFDPIGIDLGGKRVAEWSDFYKQGDIDDTASLNRAIASSAERIHFSGSKNISGNVITTRPIIITGDGRLSQINFTSNDGWIKVAGTSQSVVSGVEFEYLTFSAVGYESVPHIFMDWARQIKFTKCFFYHCGLSCNHMNFWNISDCELYDSDISVRYTRDLGEANEVSGAPRCTSTFFSNSMIDLQDCVDLMMTNCHMFQKGIKSRIVNLKNEGGDPSQQPKSTYFISNSIFDSIYGVAWDLWDVAGSSFIGNFISSGRDQNTDGAYFYRGWHNKVIGNTFLYCGSWGLTMESSEESMISCNTLVGNRAGGARTAGTCKGILFNGNDLGANPALYGAPYTVQPVGYSDVSSSSTRIRVTGNIFRPGDMATPIYLPVTFDNQNIIQGNDGVIDVLGKNYVGTTAQRPAGVTPGYGPYFDTTLGIPIWFSGGTTWKNSSGGTV